MSQIVVAGRTMESFVIEGARPLNGRIEAAGNKNGALPILAACLLTDEPVTLANVPHIRDVETMTELIADLGAEVDWLGTNEVRVHAAALSSHELDPMLSSRIRASFLLAGPLLARVPSDQALVIRDDLGGQIPKLEDGPWPAFPADLTSIALAVATQAAGTILIFEKMFENRLFFVDKLVSMGARIILCDPHRAIVAGPSKLYGQRMASPDIRAGMAMLIASLCAFRTRRRRRFSASLTWRRRAACRRRRRPRL